MELSRRQILQSMSCGFGYMAFAGMAHEAAGKETAFQNPLSPKPGHFEPKAKRVIFL